MKFLDTLQTEIDTSKEAEELRTLSDNLYTDAARLKRYIKGFPVLDTEDLAMAFDELLCEIEGRMIDMARDAALAADEVEQDEIDNERHARLMSSVAGSGRI